MRKAHTIASIWAITLVLGLLLPATVLAETRRHF